MWSTSCSDVLVAISSKFYALLSNQGSTNIKQNRSMHHKHREYAHKIRNKYIKSKDHFRNTTRWPRISNVQSEACSTKRARARQTFPVHVPATLLASAPSVEHAQGIWNLRFRYTICERCSSLI